MNFSADYIRFLELPKIRRIFQNSCGTFSGVSAWKDYTEALGPGSVSSGPLISDTRYGLNHMSFIFSWRPLSNLKLLKIGSTCRYVNFLYDMLHMLNIFNRMFIKSCILHELFCSNDSKSIILLNIWQVNPSGSPHSLLLSSTPQSKIQFLEMHFASLQKPFL